MKKASNPHFKVAAITAMTIFSLLSVFVGVFAWFTAMRSVNTDSSAFEVTSYDGFVTGLKVFSSVSNKDDAGNITGYQSYVYDLNSPLATYEVVEGYKTLKRTDDSTSTPMLGQYSSLMENKPTMLFLFSLNPEVGNQDRSSLKFKVLGKTTYENSHFWIENKKPTKELKATENDLSAIVEFSGLAVTKDNLTALTSDGKYYMDGTKVKSIDFSSESLTKCHIPTVSASSGSTAGDFNVTYENSLTLNPLTLTPNYPEYVALVCEYYEDALEYLYAINLGNEYLNQDSLGFSCDFDLEVV